MNRLLYNTLIIAFFSLQGCNGCSSDEDSDISYLESDHSFVHTTTDSIEEIDVTYDDCIVIPSKKRYGNTISIPVKINGLNLDMTYDTGSTDTQITLAEAKYLYDKGWLTDDDILDYERYRIANGQLMIGLRINLKSVSILDQIKLHDIEAVVVENSKAPLLLGQSVMHRFKKIEVDNESGNLKFCN